MEPIVISDDSETYFRRLFIISYLSLWDSEIVEKPTPAKKKRLYVLIATLFAYMLMIASVVAKHNTTPSPGSQAYKDLPAVSVS